MTEDQIIWAALTVLAIVIAFKVGRQHERDEGPRKAAAAQREAEVEGAIALLCADYIYKGPDSANAPSLLEGWEPQYPGITKFWNSLSHDDRTRMGEEALVRFADPQLQADMEQNHARTQRILGELKDDLAELSGGR